MFHRKKLFKFDFQPGFGPNIKKMSKSENCHDRGQGGVGIKEYYSSDLIDVHIKLISTSIKGQERVFQAVYFT